VCGRYQRRSDKQRIAEAFALGNVDGLALELTPDYNVAPQTTQPVIVWDEGYGSASARARISSAQKKRWAVAKRATK
jgi:putative SOS response-associated peptidase YedK